MEIKTKIDFIIIGAQKSATTFLPRCLSDHPEVYMPKNEISYFEDPDYNKIPYIDFINQFSEVESNKKIGIKRPSYFHKEECSERIKNTFPNVKLIVVLRDPVSRFISAYFHYIRFGFFPVMDINKAIPGLINNVYKKKWPRCEEILLFSIYNKQIDDYKALFGKDKLLILNQENIIKNKTEFIRQCYQFLDINDDFKSNNLESTPKASIYSLLRLKLLTKQNKYFFKYYFDNKRLTLRKMNKKEKFLTKTISGIDKYIASKLFINKKPVITIKNKQLLNNFFSNT